MRSLNDQLKVSRPTEYGSRQGRVIPCICPIDKIDIIIGYNYNQIMTLSQLKYILALESTGSFSKAARRCFVSQPTLSVQIKNLEEELGVTIFDRGRQPVRPTLIGQQILEQARESQRGIARIPEIIKESQNQIRGELRLGVIPTVASYLLPRALTSFMERYPLVKLRIDEQVTDRLVERLKHDELDAAVIVTPLYDTKIAERPLYYEAFNLYVSPGHPLGKNKTVALTELKSAEMALLTEGHCMRNQMLLLCRDSVKPSESVRLSFASGSLDTLRRVVASGYGYTLLPELAVAQLSESERERVRRLRGPVPVREISMISTRAVARRALVNALAEHIRKGVPRRMHSAPGERVVQWKAKPASRG